MCEVMKQLCGLRLGSATACRDCGFESRLGPGCLSLVCFVCCEVEVSVTGRYLVQRSPTERVYVCVCVIECDQVQQ